MPDQQEPNLQSQPSVQADGIMGDIVNKINNARSILVALSKNPSVDEMAAAIALSIYLDKRGKIATAIYSGKTPDALEFLRPEETFEHTADVLQDFVIALDKEKADHLRYKVDGDFVKIYITPYKAKITSSDLDYSYGDYNVDLVLALDVANGVDLDSALREHGRIMHDAAIVNITTSAPGKFGEVEWSDQASSCVSEMITRLLFAMDQKPEKEEATALLTGIVAATGSFSNARTTSDTMKISSDLMEVGANQQLVAMHINVDTENELFKPAADSGDFDILHADEAEKNAEEAAEAGVLPVAKAEVAPEPVEEPVAPVEEPTVEFEPTPEPEFETMPEPTFEAAEEPVSEPVAEPESVIEQELKEAEENLTAQAGGDGLELEQNYEDAAPVSLEADPVVNAPEEVYGAQGVTIEPTDPTLSSAITPAEEANTFEGDGNMERYGQMLEEALAEQGDTVNPAATSAPVTPVEPEINGVPVINYAPAADEILAPAPMPPVNMDAVPEPAAMPVEMLQTQAAPVVEPVAMPEAAPVVPEVPEMPVEPMAMPVEQPVAQPVAQPQPQAYVPQDGDVSAFKIPNVN